ncbi:origin recognition complex subunit 2 isoform X2 [Myxocyprinus asiaticus]|uniref:origin recognition complex subunit 2 isoform X2 n=1 Tax=Myxocyprinus asiaticus TaxID=70543 RepID=UPI002221D784|nr:origin recognition complex subunit 2 isoform X2 [Myxocyprinus asiaticus]
MAQKQTLEVRFVSDEDVLDHIVEKQQDTKPSAHGSTQMLVTLKTPQKSKTSIEEEDEEEEELFNEQIYVEALGTGTQDEVENGSVAAGSSVFSFQSIKRANKMAQMASELARTPGKSVTFCTSDTNEESTSPTRTAKKSANQNKTPQKGKKVQFISTTPHRLRKRLSAPSLRSDSESDFSPSNSEDDDDGEELDGKKDTQSKTPSKNTAAALYKTPSKKGKKVPESDLVEEYFEAHSSSKVLTSDRTLQKLQTPKLDRETLLSLLSKNPSSFAEEIHQLNAKHEKNFNKWMLQLHMGFNILIYGLGSKKLLLEKFRTSMLSDYDHLVVNGFFPSITLKSILNSITGDVLEHEGTFRNLTDQINFIVKTLKEVWDQAKTSMFSWLWYETTTYLPYTEETSYENSLLVQQTGALALSSLTHVMRSLTPNARGIFRLLAEFQLENKDNPAYTGLSFQDFYQRCREAFLVNSDITLRTQLTEFRDHKLIRTKKGADGVEYLLIPVDNGTLTDFLERNDVE